MQFPANRSCLRPRRWFSASCLALACGLHVFRAVAAQNAAQDWPSYLGDPTRSHYSTLDQINTTNVKKLEIAWTFHCGDLRPNRSQMQCSPLIINGVMYCTTPRLRAIALDAATGEELWRFDPSSDGVDNMIPGVNRGVVYWEEGDDKRILYVSSHFLYALNAKSGKLIPSFGKGGKVDIKDGSGRDVSKLYMSSTSPGTVYRNLLMLPTRVAEGPGPAAPGYLRAYDIRTGKIAWTFHTIPQPGEFGCDTWPPDAWKTIGGVNCWAGMSLDEQRGIVYVPTGSATFDFWGGNRIGQNLFADCLLALDAATGKRLWHFQMIHHDLWDRDLPAPPNLVTVQHNGKAIDAVAQVTKSGHVYVFDRQTGESLFPIEEKPRPLSDLQGEMTWPTQPLPTKPAPFVRQVFSVDQITDVTPESHKAVLEIMMKVRPHTPFLPPSREGTIIFPGFDGGAEWGGAAVDPKQGILYVNANEIPWILQMVETKPKDNQLLSGGHQIYNQLCVACHGVNRSGDPARAFPSLVDVGKRLTKRDIIQLLDNGKGMMPSFAFLSAIQDAEVADFLLNETLTATATTNVTKVASAPANTTALATNKDTLSTNSDLSTLNSQLSTNSDDILLNEPYTHTGYNRWFDPYGLPAIKPPWGTLNAIDLNAGEYVWRTTLGEYPELTAHGIPPTGTENYGGPILTAGGLIFIGASRDEMFRAFDQKTGKLLWVAKLPAGGYSTPATYMVKGRQYVVIACGGGKSDTKPGDAYVAFALPK